MNEYRIPLVAIVNRTFAIELSRSGLNAAVQTLLQRLDQIRKKCHKNGTLDAYPYWGGKGIKISQLFKKKAIKKNSYTETNTHLTHKAIFFFPIYLSYSLLICLVSYYVKHLSNPKACSIKMMRTKIREGWG